MTATNNILSLLESLVPPEPDEVARKLADDFRRRRLEKGLTREAVAQESGVAVSNIIRFERQGLISLKNLISLAIATGYIAELQSVFAEPKFQTMEELTQIRRNSKKQRGSRSHV